MKLTKTLLAAVAMVAFAAPLTASAQMGGIVGQATNVVGDTVVERGGEFFQLQDMSAFQPGDIISSRSGSVDITLTERDGTTCTATIPSGMQVRIGMDNFCENLGGLTKIGARDAVMNAGQRAVSGSSMSAGSAGGSTAGGSVLSSNGLLYAAGAIVAVGAVVALTDDNDDDDISN